MTDFTQYDSEIKTMAVAKWPAECCGVVTPTGVVWVQNEHEDARNHFRMAPETWTENDVLAVVHSHTVETLLAVTPGGYPDCPSQADMTSYLESGVPWGVVCCDSATANTVRWMNDAINLNLPLEGRTFISGITDCYSLVRAYYWQTRKIVLGDYPRGPDWYVTQNLYMERYASEGFEIIDRSRAAVGDLLYFAIGDTRWPNHSGVLIENSLLLHHPAPYPVFGRNPTSRSRREPLGRWMPYMTHVLRRTS